VKQKAFDVTSMPGCFDGVIPPVIATCSAEGVPNLTHLSQLYPVDDRHVALSNQFFSKTTANLAENPRASVLVTDSETLDTYRLSLRFERSETSGSLFDELRASIDAIAAMMGATEVFKLRAADVYRVVDCAHVAGPTLTP
jgi:adenylate cyclase